jgi:hypothetical protein
LPAAPSRRRPGEFDFAAQMADDQVVDQEDLVRSSLSLRPSPALLVGIAALCLGLGGTAIAGPDGIREALTKAKVTKAKVKKISKEQANKQIDKRAPGLSVANAATADSADSFGGMTATRIDPFTLSNGENRELGTFGPFTLTATCVINATNTDEALVTITTSQNNSAFKGEDDDADFDVGDSVPYVEAGGTPTGVPYFEEDGGAAIAPDGTGLPGNQLYAGANVLGEPGKCRFGGVIFAG